VERPRIVLLVTLAEHGGAQTYVASLLPALEGFDVIVAAHGDGPLREAAAGAGARFVHIPSLVRDVSPWHDARCLVELATLFRRERPHIVHANSSKAGILGRVAGALAGVPIRIFTAHGWAFAAHRGAASVAYRWADRLVRPLTTAVVCVAEHERAAGVAAGTCRPERTVVIHNGVEMPPAPERRAEAAEARIVFVGRLQTPKDPVTLLRALARLEAGTFTAELVGDGPERAAVEAEIRRLGLDDSVRILGGRDDVGGILGRADVFVLASRSEGLPLSILEAMAAGLPVVASRVGGVPEAVVEGKTGFLVPAGDAAALAEALRRLVADPELRLRLGQAARERAQATFAIERFREAHLGLYRRELAADRLPLPSP
jgi:glycosyltransferase involved in cell wall biosynthesis